MGPGSRAGDKREDTPNGDLCSGRAESLHALPYSDMFSNACRKVFFNLLRCVSGRMESRPNDHTLRLKTPAENPVVDPDTHGSDRENSGELSKILGQRCQVPHDFRPCALLYVCFWHYNLISVYLIS